MSAKLHSNTFQEYVCQVSCQNFKNCRRSSILYCDRTLFQVKELYVGLVGASYCIRWGIMGVRPYRRGENLIIYSAHCTQTLTVSMNISTRFLIVQHFNNFYTIFDFGGVSESQNGCAEHRLLKLTITLTVYL